MYLLQCIGFSISLLNSMTLLAGHLMKITIIVAIVNSLTIFNYCKYFYFFVVLTITSYIIFIIFSTIDIYVPRMPLK